MVHLHNRNSNIGTYIWISSQKNDLDAHMKELKNWFSQRGYPAKAISEQVNRTLTLEENVKEKDGQHMKENIWQSKFFSYGDGLNSKGISSE